MGSLSRRLDIAIAQIEKKQLQVRIKGELSSVGKSELWKLIERYTKVSTAVRLYELAKD